MAISSLYNFQSNSFFKHRFTYSLRNNVEVFYIPYSVSQNDSILQPIILYQKQDVHIDIGKIAYNSIIKDLSFSLVFFLLENNCFIALCWFLPYNSANQTWTLLPSFLKFIFISWRLITLQYCSGFCHTLTWISHGFTCVPHPDPPSHLASLLSLLCRLLSHPSRSLQSTGLGSLYYIADSH